MLLSAIRLGRQGAVAGPRGLPYTHLQGSIRHMTSTGSLLSGHSKWSTIKHDKAKNDALRSKISTKFANLISMSVKEGGSPDPSMNVRLQANIDNAVKANVPKKVIENAIKRGSGESSGPGERSEVAVYEGVGPGGVAFVVEALTDNRNRTSQQVRAAFVKYAGTLSPTQYLFERQGWIRLDAAVELTDELLEQVLEVGGTDIVEEDGALNVYTNPHDTAAVANALKSKYKLADVGIGYTANPDTVISSLDESKLESFNKLVNALEDLDDVTEVYYNYE